MQLYDSTRVAARDPAGHCQYVLVASQLSPKVGELTMARHALTHLWDALSFDFKEVFQFDFYLGVLGGGAAVALAVFAPSALLRATATDAVLLGVIIGAVVAGVAILAAFMDQPFLRKLAAINRSPVRYLAPFIFTAAIGIFASLSLIALSALSNHSPLPLLVFFGGIAGFLSFWTIASLLPCLSMIIQFMGLKVDALDVPGERVD